MMTNDKLFLGTGWSFPPEFVKEGKNAVEMTADVEDINASIQILTTTVVGERILQAEYGADLSQYLFEPLNLSTETQIRDRLEKALLLYEPRIKVNQMTFQPEYEEGRLMIEVVYTIRATNTRFNLVFPYYLNEATNIES